MVVIPIKEGNLRPPTHKIGCKNTKNILIFTNFISLLLLVHAYFVDY